MRVVRGLGLGLDEKAVDAVNQWKFRPGMRNGQPVAVMATIDVNFSLLDNGQKSHWRLSRAEFRAPENAPKPMLVYYSHPQSHNYRKPTLTPVLVELQVDEQGRPQNLWVGKAGMAGSAAEIDSSMTKDLLTAAKLWYFTPSQKDGKAVPSTVTLEFIWAGK